MSEDNFINMINVAMILIGMFIALVIGYIMGYRDAKRLYE
jgi:hypothetical protein